VRIADILLADVGMRGLPHPRRLTLVAEQAADWFGTYLTPAA